MRDELIAALAGRAERALELQTGLTAIPALSPENGGEGEERKALWLEEKLRSFGLTNIEHVDAPDPRVPSGKRPNMIVRVPGGRSVRCGYSLILMSCLREISVSGIATPGR